jgi:dimethylhistidine N-methyltransferase
MRPFGASANHASEQTSVSQFASDVEYYLTLEPRQLPSRYFYDELGSALFEAICLLPWYRITRAEMRLIKAHGREIFRRLDSIASLVELGPGSGQKLVTLIETGRIGSRPLDLHLIDVSRSALVTASGALGALDAVRVLTHQASYEAGLADLGHVRRSEGPMLALFLGSNIGNFDRPGADAFLGGIRAALTDGDALLVGADLVKPEPELLLAYDDPLGVTAAFNRNLLARVNRELGGDFDISAFGHRAVWNAEESRVEMHLVSLRRQRIRVAAARTDIVMAEGETIWTESSYKYQPGEIAKRAEAAGFSLIEEWIDGEDGFALTLLRSA